MKNICRWCGRGSIACPAQNECLSEQEQRDLVQYVAREGKFWRSRLRAEWASGSAVLRQVRNIIGPSGLDRMKPSQFPK